MGISCADASFGGHDNGTCGGNAQMVFGAGTKSGGGRQKKPCILRMTDAGEGQGDGDMNSSAAMPNAREEPPEKDAGGEEKAADRRDSGEGDAEVAAGGEDADGHLWVRPSSERKKGGSWLVRRHIQVWLDVDGKWHTGKVVAYNGNASARDRLGRLGCVHAVEYADLDQTMWENLGRMRWKLDQHEDSKTSAVLPERVAGSGGGGGKRAITSAPSVQRAMKRMKLAAKCAPALSNTRPVPGSKPFAAGAGGAAKISAAMLPKESPPNEKPVGPVKTSRAMAGGTLRKKIVYLNEQLHGTGVSTGSGSDKRLGVLQNSDTGLHVMCKGIKSTLEGFTSISLTLDSNAGKQPKEVMTVTETGESLCNFETNLSPYSRAKIRDGILVRMLYDGRDWYPGTVAGYDKLTGKYRILFDDGEVVNARHAMFDKDGFYLSEGHDCGVTFSGLDAFITGSAGAASSGFEPAPEKPRGASGSSKLTSAPSSSSASSVPSASRPSTASVRTPGTAAATPARHAPAPAAAKPATAAPDPPPSSRVLPGIKWRPPAADEKKGGQWLVGRTIQVWWEYDQRFHRAKVLSFDVSAKAQDTRGNVGPVHHLSYDTGDFPENLATCPWELDQAEDPKEDDPKSPPRAVAPRRFVVAAKRGGGSGGAPWGKLAVRRPVVARSFTSLNKPVSAKFASNVPVASGMIQKKPVLGSGGTVQKAMARVKLTATAKPKAAAVGDATLGSSRHLSEASDAMSGARASASAVPVPAVPRLALKRVAGGQGVAGGNAESVDAPLRSAEAAKIAASSAVPSTETEPGSFVASVHFRGASWHSPGVDEKAGGAWLVGRAVRVWSEEETLWLFGLVTAYDGSNDAVDSTGKTGPTHVVAAEKRSILVSLIHSKWEMMRAPSSDEESASRVGRLWASVPSSQKGGGGWLVGRRVRVFWDEDGGVWYPGVVTMYDSRPDLLDSHGNKGPVHNVMYDDGPFLENLQVARWQFDQSQGPLGAPASSSPLPAPPVPVPAPARPSSLALGSPPASAASTSTSKVALKPAYAKQAASAVEAGDALRSGLPEGRGLVGSEGGAHAAAAQAAKEERASKSAAAASKGDAASKASGSGTPRGHGSQKALLLSGTKAAAGAGKAAASRGGSGGGGGGKTRIETAGRAWTAPKGLEERSGGVWLVGRVIRVYWSPQEGWMAGRVNRYDCKGVGGTGGVHEVRYDGRDGMFMENLAEAKWEFDMNEGAPRSAAIERDSSSKSDGDVSSGAVWESPVGHEKSGGLWLVGRRIRTKRGDEGWCECKVVSFEASGHVVQVAAEEASKNCDLSSVKWEFDIKQGPAGFALMKFGVGGGGGAGGSVHEHGGGGGAGGCGRSVGGGEEGSFKQQIAASSGAPEIVYSIPVKGRVWETPHGAEREGGEWLVGRCIRVYWDSEKKWYPGVVGSYSGLKTSVDSHGNKGPVHDVFYEDGSYLENLSNARWQYDLREGAAAHKKRGRPAATGRVGGLAPPRSSDIVDMVIAGGSLTSPMSAKRKAYNSNERSPGKMGRFAPRSPMKPAFVSGGGANGGFAPLGDAWEICSIRREGGGPGGGEIEWEISSEGGSQEWRPDAAVKVESLFKQKLCDFVRAAFPDNTVLHPKWMEDFRDHVWEWGYRHSAGAEEGARDEGCAYDSVTAVRVLRGGKTEYRCSREDAGDAWIEIDSSTSRAMHRLASSFLFKSIGVVSFHMGRVQLRHLLRHLSVDDVFQKGWEDFNEEAKAFTSALLAEPSSLPKISPLKAGQRNQEDEEDDYDDDEDEEEGGGKTRRR